MSMNDSSSVRLTSAPSPPLRCIRSKCMDGCCMCVEVWCVRKSIAHGGREEGRKGRAGGGEGEERRGRDEEMEDSVVMRWMCEFRVVCVSVSRIRRVVLVVVVLACWPAFAAFAALLLEVEWSRGQPPCPALPGPACAQP